MLEQASCEKHVDALCLVEEGRVIDEYVCYLKSQISNKKKVYAHFLILYYITYN